ncbi:MAG: sulfite reductase subunit A [Actinomycetales bacterium]|nr:4Fe-4S dicluster domain-containing protein [Tetrasphaera sp.]NLW98886.1 sulfite reductase subunit A [Actinomycetales bacterium]
MTKPGNVARTVMLDGLQELIDALLGRGYTVFGPTVVDGVIDYRPITSVTQLPQGWGDVQDNASYRLRRRDDDAVFAFACGAQSAKPVLFPADELLWRARLGGAEPEIERAVDDKPAPPYAFLGLRSCDLAAIGIHDRVLSSRQFGDTHYALRREDTLIVAVTCTDPAGTCFCVSMDTGPVPRSGFDLAVTELYADGPHRFVVEAGTPRGEELLDQVASTAASDEDLVAAERVGAEAAARMGRVLDGTNLKDLLYDNTESPVWDDVASRCLRCTNCTLVCPTCFCTSITDASDLTGTTAERHRVWDSCFSEEYSYIHGGAVRESGRSRYRQWMTHKLAAWHDQFGSSGCVGCGRCITWCPAAIDITAEVAELRRLAEQRQRPQEARP